MIERLLAADAALERGELDAAERLYRQVADADPRNAIALVGLARVTEARGDAPGARDLAERALAIDADEAAARRMLDALTTPATAALPPTVAPAPRGGLLGFIRRLLRRG
ncbi:MAG TPA: tetratricopeptide repeat protein [Candidatus Limnocylindrales bacterium]|jgi:tetratricopeptide (TPR) repeat protein|nr:tetratricopeptide repeat protein [Candidatus Limnocylindrales bacterium]